jgi:hypothetical protein
LRGICADEGELGLRLRAKLALGKKWAKEAERDSCAEIPKVRRRAVAPELIVERGDMKEKPTKALGAELISAPALKETDEIAAELEG